MIRTAASAIALAVATLALSAPATAAQRTVKQRTTQTSTTTARTHSTVDPRPASIDASTSKITTTTSEEGATYVSQDALYLPDPQHLDHATWNAVNGEITIASALNASLDRWRSCNWSGQEEAAAAFVAWSREHLISDRSRMSAGDVEPAWKAFGRASARRVAYAEDGVFNSTNVGCDATVGDRASMMADMERQARALARVHAFVHLRAATTTTGISASDVQTVDDDVNVKR